LTQFTDEIEYLFKLLDVINEFVLQKSDDFNAFLIFYDANKSTFSIASPESENAITITSIHRSKGLEYPVVISPFVSWTHQPKSEQIWFDLKDFQFDSLRLNEIQALNYYYGKVTPKELASFDSLAVQQRIEYDAVFLDSLNMLYVAFTRPKQHLHILLAVPNDEAHPLTKLSFQNSLGQIVLDYCKSTEGTESSVPDFIQDKSFVDYYLLQDATSFIKFQHDDVEVPQKQLSLGIQIEDVVNFRIQTNKEDLYTSAQSKRERGELVHDFLAKIPDLDFYSENKERLTKHLDSDTLNLLDAVLSNEGIKCFFRSNELLFSERDILCPDGSIVRPDRVIKQGVDVIIIDFKTGKAKDEHRVQLVKYKKHLSELGYASVRSVLIYIENQIVENV
jgi:ATP-dependent exoDNAse (exonuclease V) beta subunit